ncbi:uncharacterized protein LOC121110490 isoform X1 [Gallus gallus]|uniref:uncharacterized protein LOC121110490 isoform X1 n=1 Tax=Gallus gallus TaxID=9031 RepID=UPI001F013B3E|nr:uncharacterized protein LOC121110490 isoform X1 [Gallus gallus]
MEKALYANPCQQNLWGRKDCALALQGEIVELLLRLYGARGAWRHGIASAPVELAAAKSSGCNADNACAHVPGETKNSVFVVSKSVHIFGQTYRNRGYVSLHPLFPSFLTGSWRRTLDQSPGWSDAASAHCLLPALLQPQDQSGAGCSSRQDRSLSLLHHDGTQFRFWVAFALQCCHQQCPSATQGFLLGMSHFPWLRALLLWALIWSLHRGREVEAAGFDVGCNSLGTRCGYELDSKKQKQNKKPW